MTKVIPDFSLGKPDTTKRPCPGVKTADLDVNFIRDEHPGLQLEGPL